uniref:HTH cro/C1-type domain-containing protein n=1 Tax=uncultured prokaryote TaxID=198431 RepID=A0A0H5QDX7_9ZZZZ|nr:hypothetical protein [uncultured prokaryote]
MVTTYRYVNWVFNTVGWIDAVASSCDEHGVKFVAEIMECNESTVTNWKNGKMHAAFPYPHLTNLLKFCNTFNYDVRDFFQLEEV